MTETEDPFEKVVAHDDRERQRYETLKKVLGDWSHLFADQEVLDFGASSGLSIAALLRNGARSVVGVEPDARRVETGVPILEEARIRERSTLQHVPDTRKLPYESGRFQFVLANAVFEHIPQPRDPFVRELWRVVARGGHLMINETPNKYFPKEEHTTGLWFNHWLPEHRAHRRAVRRRRFDDSRTDWESSGWRGLGYFEFVRALESYRLVPERSRPRHRLFAAVGLPASLLDPYPSWVFQKI